MVVQPPRTNLPNQMYMNPYGNTGVTFAVQQKKLPYDVSDLSQDHLNNLKMNRLTKTLVPLSIVLGVLSFSMSWFFGISAYLWSIWVLLHHRSIFSKLPHIEPRENMAKLLPIICWIPLLNMMFIPISQDELRRQLNLQYSLRGKMLPMSRSPIIAGAWTQNLSILLILPLIIFATTYESLRDWEISVISLFWHIPIVLVSAYGLFLVLKVTNKSQFGWWPPTRASESKSGRDLVGSSFVPLFIILLTIFSMMMVVLPIIGGECGYDYFYDDRYCDDTEYEAYLAQIWIVLPCALTLFLGLSSKGDKSKISDNRGLLYSMYLLAMLTMALIPYLFIFTTFVAMGLSVVAQILLIVNEINLDLSVNKLSTVPLGTSVQNANVQPRSMASMQGQNRPMANPQQMNQPMPIQMGKPIVYTPQMNLNLPGGNQQMIPQQAMAHDMNELTKTRNRFTRNQMFASGGMAAVYRCIDNVDGSLKVWKQAHGIHIPLNDANSRLKYEAEVLKLANHPRIPRFFGFTDVKNAENKDENVLIMEFIDGGDLKSTVNQVSKVGLSLPTHIIIGYLKQMCEPLVYLSTLPEPIYHRDLKPHNIIVHPNRGTVIIDWGLAKAVQGGSDISVTRGGSGTWTSPERDSGVSGPYTDVYSLGKILYYLATCKQPPAIIANSEKEEMVSSGRPEWLADLMIKAAWPRHQERIQSVEDFLQILNENTSEDSAMDEEESSEQTNWG